MFKRHQRRVGSFIHQEAYGAQRPCSGPSSVCAADEVSQSFDGNCQCVRTKNSFVPGAEGARVNFRHRPSWAVDAQASGLPPLPDVQTSIKVKPLNGDRLVELDPAVTNAAAMGGSIRLPLTELLSAAGISSLDDTNTLVQSDYPASSGNPSFRITGLAFDIQVNYEGSLTSGRGVSAVIVIEPREGWIHLGNALSYNDDSVLAPTAAARRPTRTTSTAAASTSNSASRVPSPASKFSSSSTTWRRSSSPVRRQRGHECDRHLCAWLHVQGLP